MGENKERSTGVLQGTLDMLVLKAPARGPLHGYDVIEYILAWSGDVLRLEEGALYPAAHRLELRGPAGERVGRIYEQPAGEVLPFDGGGAEAVGCGVIGVGAHEWGDRARDEA
jgi:hypothetical protein